VNSNVRRRGPALALAAVIIGGHAVAAASASDKVRWTQTYTRIHTPLRAVYQRDMATDEAIDITVTLKLRHRDALERRVRRMMTRGDPEYHRWLKAEQMLVDHAPALDRARAVANYLALAGFSEVTVASNRMLISARGTAGTVRRAFNARMAHFERDGRLGFANVTDAEIPSDLADVVLAVLGLQTLDPMRTLNIRADQVLLSGSVHGLNPTQFPVAYNAAGLPTVSTVTVGIITQGDMTQAIADLHQFQS
jgi:pseudomonalisin